MYSRMNQNLLNDEDLNRIQTDCTKAIKNIAWKHNADLSNCKTIKQAIRLAREGFDGGPEASEMFKPKTRAFSEWMDYAHLLTICYNCDKEIRKFTILRTRIQFIQHLLKTPSVDCILHIKTYVFMIHIYLFKKLQY